MAKFLGKWLVGILFAAFLVAEIWFSVDRNAFTWPLTKEIVQVVPYPIAAAVIAWFVAWIGPHIAHAYEREGTMKAWKLEPVKIMTVTLGILVALSGIDQFMAWLPDRVAGGVLLAIAVLTAVLGKTVRDKVTPVASPHSNDGRPLVPVASREMPR